MKRSSRATEPATPAASVEPCDPAPPRHKKTEAAVHRSRFAFQAMVLLLAFIGMGGTVTALNLATAQVSPIYLALLFAAQVLVCGLCVALIYRNIAYDGRLREKQEALLQEANARLQEQADTDGLTNLRNRRAFERRLQEELVRAKRYGYGLSLLLIDVDHFKQFNDTWGHLAGDDTLRQTAAILQEQSRASDFVARFGGEEFALLLPYTSEASALLTAERIRSAFRRHDWSQQPVTISVGVTTLSPEIVAPTDLIHRADTALYWAKQQGRDRAVVANAA